MFVFQWSLWSCCNFAYSYSGFFWLERGRAVSEKHKSKWEGIMLFPESHLSVQNLGSGHPASWEALTEICWSMPFHLYLFYPTHKPKHPPPVPEYLLHKFPGVITWPNWATRTKCLKLVWRHCSVLLPMQEHCSCEFSTCLNTRSFHFQFDLFIKITRNPWGFG